MKEELTVEELIGKTMSSVVNVNGEELVFTTDDGDCYKLFHRQDCCESVTIEDICGDLGDLVGVPIIKAEESSNEQTDSDKAEAAGCDSSWTWTFYHFATVKGYVTVRWFGTSNGYYSESVDFRKVGD